MKVNVHWSGTSTCVHQKNGVGERRIQSPGFRGLSDVDTCSLQGRKKGETAVWFE